MTSRQSLEGLIDLLVWFRVLVILESLRVLNCNDGFSICCKRSFLAERFVCLEKTTFFQSAAEYSKGS